MHLLLMTVAIVVTIVDPPDASRSLLATYVVLITVAAYAAANYFAAVRRGTVGMPHPAVLPWIDIGVCAVLIALNGWDSVYFVLFFFGIAGASLRWGFASGSAATVGSIACFVLVVSYGHPVAAVFEPEHFVTRLISLAVLGYMIAFTGGYELRLRRRLALLRDIGTLSNPRFGPSRSLARALESLRAFYDADLCVAILAEPSGGHALRRATRAAPGAAQQVEQLPASLAAALLSLGEERVCLRPGVRGDVAVSSAAGITHVASNVSRYSAVAELLGVHAYLTVPLRVGTIPQGRLYVGTEHAVFDRGEEEFLQQAADTVMQVLAHVDLVERMATRAAEDERHRLALDIHDRLIQPYIGLQMGIGAVRQLMSNDPDQVLPPLLRERVATLAGLSEMGIQHLRSYTKELRGVAAAGGLPESLRRFASRFHEATGIQVRLDLDRDLRLDDGLAGEIFSIVCEAVSNVRRHTDAPSATVVLRAVEEHVVLRVENPVGAGTRRAAFVPRSITERAAALNGTVTVEDGDESGTAVLVRIPL